MKRHYSEIESNNDILEEFLAISSEKSSIESKLSSLKEVKTAKELAIHNLKKSLAVAERDFAQVSISIGTEESRIKSVQQEFDAKEREMQRTSTQYNALNSHEKILSAEHKPSSNAPEEPTPSSNASEEPMPSPNASKEPMPSSNASGDL